MFIIKTYLLMLFREMIDVNSKNRTEHINTLCGRSVRVGGMYIYHCLRRKKRYILKGPRCVFIQAEILSNLFQDLYRGINDFKKGYQPRTCIVKDEKGDLVADSHSSMTRWRNYFSQLLNVHGPKDVKAGRDTHSRTNSA